MPDIPITNYDPVLEHMKSLGIPLTRANYVRMAGMVEQLEGEHDGYVISLPLVDEVMERDVEAAAVATTEK